MKLWKYIVSQLAENHAVILMCVIESIGSSPGRQGFKMAVASDGSMSGSIGGGIMEHKLVELSRTLLKGKSAFKPFVKRQIHQKTAKNKSGMICSGELSIAFYYLDKSNLEQIDRLVSELSTNETPTLKLENQLFEIMDSTDNQPNFQSSIVSEEEWSYTEKLGYKNSVYILGGGHVGLALSEMMNKLDFHVTVIDDRESLNTVEQNEFAHQSEIIDFDQVADFISEKDSTYVVVVSFGYRTDKQILKQLIGRKYKYLGMMGSEAKIKTLFEELLREGYTQSQLDAIHSPIGVPIHSKTPFEIAVSIAGEIIKVKNE